MFKRIAGVVVALVAMLSADAPAQTSTGEQAFERECGRCHAAAEVRQTISGVRRLYWTDERLVAFLTRHHAHDEEQARLILRFLRASP